MLAELKKTKYLIGAVNNCDVADKQTLYLLLTTYTFIFQGPNLQALLNLRSASVYC